MLAYTGLDNIQSLMVLPLATIELLIYKLLLTTK
jgi:hypothetical protein